MGKEFNYSALLVGGDCACGRAHAIDTKRIDIGAGALGRVGQTARQAGLSGRTLVVADPNTYEAAGRETIKALQAEGFETELFVFPAGEIHTNERAVGSVLLALADGITFITAVGSGTINDTCRYVARRTGLPYIVVGTAPSMDGYASTVTPAVRGGFKVTLPAIAPLAVVGDTAVLQGAPAVMMAAGLGDVFGKITARIDWIMGHRILGEYRCETVAGLMQQAVDGCMAAAPGLPGRGAEATEGLMNALTLSGIAMQMVKDSRPASGAEHQVAHFFEMLDMARGRPVTLHGDKVGVAELMMMRLYEKLFEPKTPIIREPQGISSREDAIRRDMGAFGDMLLSEKCSAYYDDLAVQHKVQEGAQAGWDFYRQEVATLPKQRTEGEQLIRLAGGPVRPADLGYSREDTLHALLYAMELRQKFTVLRMAHMTGRLNELATEIADEFCE